jgi:hypothetical protein
MGGPDESKRASSDKQSAALRSVERFDGLLGPGERARDADLTKTTKAILHYRLNTNIQAANIRSATSESRRFKDSDAPSEVDLESPETSEAFGFGWFGGVDGRASASGHSEDDERW